MLKHLKFHFMIEKLVDVLKKKLENILKEIINCYLTKQNLLFYFKIIIVFYGRKLQNLNQELMNIFRIFRESFLDAFLSNGW